MKSQALKRWAWVIAGIGWGGLYALAFHSQSEPLTGWLPATYFTHSFLQGLFIGLATFCFLNLRWRVVGGLLTLMVLFFGFPMPSMAGLTLRLENNCRSTIVVSVARTDQAGRQVAFRLLPNSKLEYKTAPGDWSGDAGLTITCNQHQTIATIRELRQKEIIFSETGISVIGAEKTTSHSP